MQLHGSVLAVKDVLLHQSNFMLLAAQLFLSVPDMLLLANTLVIEAIRHVQGEDKLMAIIFISLHIGQNPGSSLIDYLRLFQCTGSNPVCQQPSTALFC